MLRWLFIVLIIYALYRLLFKPKSNSGSNTMGGRRRKKNLEHIEEAEYEDITDKEKTKKRT